MNIVAIVLLIVVAVSLVIIFKDQIGNFLKNIMESIGGRDQSEFEL